MNIFQSSIFPEESGSTLHFDNNQSKGYTLIEVIITIQIFLIVLTMVYTIYLFGNKFMVRWSNDNDLLATELLIQKSLTNELATAKKICEISEIEIIYIDRNYNLRKITWPKESLFIKSKPVNKHGITFRYQNITFLKNSKDKKKFSTLTEIDINKDDKINNSELDKISFLLINYLLSNNTKKSHYQFELQILK